MHSNAANTRRFSYAAIFGRDGLPARHMAKILMGALMILGMATQARAVVEQVAPASSQLICFSLFCNDNGTYFDGTSSDPFSKKYTFDSAQAWCSFATWTYSDRAPEGRFLAFYTCGNFAFALISASCPIPTNNPGARYTLNTSSRMCEREVQQYTIALHNLGGEINTSASRAAYAQVMEGAAAKSGIAVTLKTTALPEAGTATLSPTDGKGTTDVEGKFNFTFNAPPVAGTHTVTATCDGGKCSNQATGTIVVTACPVKDNLSEISALSKKFNETPEQIDLTNKLESGMDGYSLLSPATQAAEKCLKEKFIPLLTLLGSAKLYDVGSTVRTYAYQEHLREVWDKFRELQKAVDQNPANQQRCQKLISKVEGKMGFLLTQDPTLEGTGRIACNNALGGAELGHRSHCIRAQPARTNPKHVDKTAFDIASNAVDGVVMFLKLRNAYNETSDTVHTVANACGLNWGATFNDSIHFSLQ